MPYVTQTRASTGALSMFAANRSLSRYDMVQPKIVHVGNITTMVDGKAYSVTKLYTYPGNMPYGQQGGVVGEQTTYSWRTGHGLDSEGGKGEDLTGEEMRNAIYHGYDIDISSNVTGQDRIIDRRGAPLVGNTDYSSFDNGHNFWTEKTVHQNAIDRYKRLNWPVRLQSGTGFQYDILDWWGYPPSCDSLSFSVPWALSEAQRNFVGNRLYKSALPTRPYSQTVRAIGELLKDGVAIPLLAAGGAGPNLFKAVGGEYLSFQFGYAPLISDIKKLLNAVLRSATVVQLYAKHQGDWKRRERKVDEPKQSGVLTQPMSGLYWTAAYGSPSGGQHDLTRFLANSYAGMNRNGVWSFERDHKFVGEFSYALPDQESVLSRFKLYAAHANHLLGLQLTPDVLFDLAPWSWLTDWAADFGTVLDNAVAQGTDCLVMKYGYIMTHDVFKSSVVVTGVKSALGVQLPAFCTSETLIERKYRDRANPFGFGVNPGSLTNFQWSILAALGLSRGRNIKWAEPLN